MRNWRLRSGFGVKVRKYNMNSYIIQGIDICLLCQAYRNIRLKIMIKLYMDDQMYKYDKFGKVHIQFSTTTLPIVYTITLHYAHH